MAKPLPLVAICGRPNVGKSTLYNRLIGKSRAIVHGEEGITRDRHYGTAEYEGHKFRVVDTGGIVESPIDPILKKMQEQVRVALAEARVIVFVVDGQQEITRVDEELRDELFKHGKPVVLAVNKCDNERMALHKHEFYNLGIGEPIAVSASHNLGVDELFDAIVEHLPPPSEKMDENDGGEGAEEAPVEAGPTKVAIVGKPNVGKSSFVNAVLNEERTIVTDVPGTTRDAIDIDFRWQDREYILIDTAGMRRKAGIKKDVERFSVNRSLRAVKRADVCLIFIDATEGISEQDKRIIGFARESGTAMIIVWTKWDLIEDKEGKFKAFADEIDLKIPAFKYIPYITVSNTERTRLFKVFELIDKIAGEASKRIATADLNAFFTKMKLEQKAAHHHAGGTAKILYATQTAVKPTTFILFVNQKKLFHFSYLRYIENRLRERYGFTGVPLQLELREGKPK